jgi:integrase/recombinase XerD
LEQKKITQLIALAKEQLKGYGYSETGIRSYVRVWERFLSYAIQNDIVFYTEELMLSFMEKECLAFSSPGSVPAYEEKMRALDKLDECNKYQMISSKRYSCRKTYEFKGKIGYSVIRYLEWKKTNVSEARLQSIKLYLERFCNYVDTIISTDESELSSEIIQGFIESCSIYTKSTVSSTACCLRGYLTFLHDHALTQSNLSVFVPHIRTRKDSEIPSAYSVDDVEKLINSIDRNNSKGRRDYAMILMAVRLGLRSSDICGLKFVSVNWEKNKINIVLQKTGEPAEYPLLEDVGLAIIDYLKNGRSSLSDEPYIFLRESPPYTRLDSGSLYTIVDTYMKRAAIHIPAGKKHGPHALRHSLSSRLLENDVPLPVISEILAHKSIETTKIYLKIAERQLFECALEVPERLKEEV